jgi:pimeloyl-ACP methyl ester carboxylesterase
MVPLVQANGLEIFYAESGRGPPILWLQGLGAEHTAWSAQLARFGVQYRCIAPDSRDVGRSARVTGSYTLADVAADAADLLRRLDAVPAHAVGLSLGGAVAQHLALDHPGLVRSLCLVSSFARQGARQRELLSAWRTIYARVDPVTFYRQANTWLFSDAFFERPRNVENVLRYVAATPRPQEPDAFARQVEAALTHDTRERLPALRLPVLVVAGEQDMLAPLRLQRELAAAIPDARMEVLPGAAHSLNLERQIDFNRLLHAFLHEVGP